MCRDIVELCDLLQALVFMLGFAIGVAVGALIG